MLPDRQGHAAGTDDLLFKVVRWALGFSVCERHRGAIGCEPPDNAGADPTRTPGDQRSAVRERGPVGVIESCWLNHDPPYVSNDSFAYRQGNVFAP
jgi:hypothetical protein